MRTITINQASWEDVYYDSDPLRSPFTRLWLYNLPSPASESREIDPASFYAYIRSTEVIAIKNYSSQPFIWLKSSWNSTNMTLKRMLRNCIRQEKINFYKFSRFSFFRLEIHEREIVR